MIEQPIEWERVRGYDRRLQIMEFRRVRICFFTGISIMRVDTKK